MNLTGMKMTIAIINKAVVPKIRMNQGSSFPIKQG